MAVPSPLVLEANSWAGNDGVWSTWPMRIGTPPQDFHVIPATSNGDVWVPVPEGCPSDVWPDPAACGASRGANIFNGLQSSGFQANSSSTWDEIGIYALPVDDEQFDDEQNGLYGTDTIGIRNTSGYLNMSGQSVAGIATKDFWLGWLGVAQRAANFSTQKAIVPSLLDALTAQNLTPSASFGLDVGAAHRNFSGSLVLGGYDRGATDGAEITVPIIEGISLAVHTRSIVLSNSLEGTLSLTHDLTSVPMVIDSTVSQLWLPRYVCDQLEANLGLTFDPSTALYVVNDTMHTRLQELAPTLSFTLAADGSSNETISIALPYAALDLQAGPPIYNTSTNYFPIRRAENQNVLGRAFLQGAYLVVDWKRGNFTISQASRSATRKRDIVPILAPREASPDSGLSIGAIVGIVICAVALVALVALLLWWRRRKRISREEEASGEPPRYSSTFPEDKKLGEIEEATKADYVRPESMSSPLYELDQDEACHQLMGDPITHELPADSITPELDATNQIHRPHRSSVASNSVPETEMRAENRQYRRPGLEAHGAEPD